MLHSRRHEKPLLATKCIHSDCRGHPLPCDVMPGVADPAGTANTPARRALLALVIQVLILGMVIQSMWLQRLLAA
jgi:hypothetical protein